MALVTHGRLGGWSALVLAAIVVVSVLASVALSRDPHRYPVDFMGVVEESRFDADWDISRRPAGLPQDLDFAIGPQILVMADGRELQVPKGTPSFPDCLRLVPPDRRVGDEVIDAAGEFVVGFTWRDRSVPCVVMGQTEAGMVVWLRPVPIVEHDGRQLAEAGWVSWIDLEAGLVMTRAGVSIPLAGSPPDCPDPDYVYALADWEVETVVAWQCFGPA
jgi:hypothetical protein